MFILTGKHCLSRFAFNELHGRQSTDGLRRGEYEPQMLR